jgi:hypothetical protein
VETGPDTTVIAPCEPLELRATIFFAWTVIVQKLVEPAERHTKVQHNILKASTSSPMRLKR